MNKERNQMDLSFSDPAVIAAGAGSASATMYVATPLQTAITMGSTKRSASLLWLYAEAYRTWLSASGGGGGSICECILFLGSGGGDGLHGGGERILFLGYGGGVGKTAR
jgi:hypothetical protein